MPRSIIAIVVPTGVSPPISPIFISAIEANLLPASTRVPNKLYNVPDGSLNGKDINDVLISPPATSISLNSPGCNAVSSSLILAPLALKPAGKLESVPESMSCLRIDVDA